MINFSTAPQNRAILGYLSRKSGNFGLLSNITKACKSAEWHEVNLIYVSRRCLNHLKSLQERSRFQATTRPPEPWFLKPPAFEKETQAGHTDPHPRGGVSFPAAEARGGCHNIPPFTPLTESLDMGKVATHSELPTALASGLPISVAGIGLGCFSVDDIGDGLPGTFGGVRARSKVKPLLYGGSTDSGIGQ